MELIKDDQRGKVFQSDKLKIFYRNKGSVSGDNANNDEELIYLISGRAEITLEDESWNVDAPAEITFPENTYHRIDAVEDITFILVE